MSKQLLFSLTKDDFVIQTFRAGGKGGQNQNKRDTGVRIVHPASGAVGESRTERNQLQNKRLAFQRLAESIRFKMWHSRVVADILHDKTVDEVVDDQMSPNNLRVEFRGESGMWETWNSQ